MKARLRLLAFRALCAPLPGGYPRGPKHVWRAWLWALQGRYCAADEVGGRDFARRYDYVPF